MDIPTSPNMFGGFGAKAAEEFGTGLEKAGSTVIDYATEQQNRLNKVDASDRLTKVTDAITDESARYTQLQGRAALDAMPEHKAKIKSIYDDAIANASNPAVKAMLAESGGRTLDRYYGYAAQHGAREENVYTKKVAADNTLSRMNQAVWAYRNGDYAGWENQRHHALAETRNSFELEGYEPQQIEAEVAKTNGKIVYDTTKLILDHPQGGPGKAEEFAKKYEKEIDAKSSLEIDGMLKGGRAAMEGQRAADRALARGPAAPVAASIATVAARYGIDPHTLTRTVQVESGGNPNAKTGSYKGLTQLSDSEFNKYNPYPGRSIWDPEANLAAGAAKMKAEGDQFAKNFGRAPSGFDIYMIHQQGLAGYSTHLANPDAPAWQNMLATGEGRQKGDGWAKAAIWGNIPDQYKASFGNVNNVTSRDFIAMWQQKFGGAGGASVGASMPNRASIYEPGERPQQASYQPGESPQQTAVAGPNSALANLPPKAEAEQHILDDPNLRDNPQAQQAAFARLNRVYEIAHGQQADQERAQRMEEHALKVQSDTTELSVMKDLYSNKPTITAQQIIEAGDKKLLSREAVERLIGQLGKADTGEHAERTYGHGFFDAYKQVHAPPGDPGRITDPSQLYAMVGPHGALTVAGVDKLVSEINARKTPEGEAEAAMKKQFFEHVARPQITFADPELKIPDPKGADQFLKFQAAAFHAYDVGKAAGKTPAELLNPESRDYIGKLIENFKLPADERFADGIQDKPQNAMPWSRIWTDVTGATNFAKVTGEPAPAAATPAFDTGSIATLADLQAAYRDKKISPDAARAVAVQRGWARQAPPPPSVPVSQ